MAADRTSLHRRLGGEVGRDLPDASFRSLFTIGVLFWVAQGVASTLGVHLNTYVWRLSPPQIFLTVFGYIIGLIIGVPLAPMTVRRFEKRTVLIASLLVLCLVQGGLTLLRVLGVFTLTGEAVVGPLFANAIVGGVAVTLTAVAVGSMMADAADEHDFLFHKRREGLYFAGLGFAAKARRAWAHCSPASPSTTSVFPRASPARAPRRRSRPMSCAASPWSPAHASRSSRRSASRPCSSTASTANATPPSCWNCMNAAPWRFSGPASTCAAAA